MKITLFTSLNCASCKEWNYAIIDQCFCGEIPLIVHDLDNHDTVFESLDALRQVREDGIHPEKFPFYVVHMDDGANVVRSGLENNMIFL